MGGGATTLATRSAFKSHEGSGVISRLEYARKDGYYE